MAFTASYPLFRWSLLFLLIMPLALLAQNVNPLTVDTTQPAPSGNSILKMQFNKASDLEKKKDYKGAVEAYTLCINNAPPASDVLKLSLNRRATCYFKLKTYDLCLHDASLVPATVPRVFLIMSSNDVVRITPQYDHDAYILSGICKMFVSPGAGCGDFKNAATIENSARYKGDKNANTFSKKYCK